MVGLFGVFLLVQTYSLRLEFTADTLVVWRGTQELRRFPTPRAELAPVRCLDSGPVLFPRSEEHSLPADLFNAKNYVNNWAAGGRLETPKTEHS